MQAQDCPNLVATAAHLQWVEQLTDYRNLLQLAHEETDILSTNRLELLYHTQTKRDRLVRRIEKRDRTLRATEATADPPSQQTLDEITTVIEAVLHVDGSNMKRLRAELTEISNSLAQLKAGRAVLGQYKPTRERLPQFLNRKV